MAASLLIFIIGMSFIIYDERRADRGNTTLAVEVSALNSPDENSTHRQSEPPLTQATASLSAREVLSPDVAVTEMRAAHYWFTPREARHGRAEGFRAPLLQHRIEAHVDRAGLRVDPLTSKDSEPAWAVTLEAAASTATSLVEEKSLLTALRPGVKEWWHSSVSGLEHGFTLEQPENALTRRRPDKKLVADFTLKVSGLRPQVQADGFQVTFYDDSGNAIADYSGLKAWDAEGDAVPTVMELNEERLSFVIADAGATYPIMIDPVFTVRLGQVTATGPQTQKGFGTTVAVAGDFMAVGHPLALGGVNQTPVGAVFLYRRDATKANGFSFHKRLVAPAGVAASAFGATLTMTENLILVGAPGNSSGSVFAFQRQTGGSDNWGEEERLFQTGVANDTFGSLLAFDPVDPLGPVFVTTGKSVTGAAVLRSFKRATGGIWTALPVINVPQKPAALYLRGGVIHAGFPDIAPLGEVRTFLSATGGSNGIVVPTSSRVGNATALRFGSSLSVQGGRLAVGCPDDNGIGTLPGRRGSVCLVDFGTFVEGEELEDDRIVGRLVNPDASLTEFGRTILWSEPRMFIGAAGGSGSGAVVVGNHNSTQGGSDLNPAVVTITGTLRETALANGARYGGSLASDGRLVVVGAPQQAPHGLAFAYALIADVGLPTEITATKGQSGDQYGLSIALEGNTLVVGAPLHDVPVLIGEEENEGAVFIFRRSSNGTWPLIRKLTPADGDPGDRFGFAVDVSGDSVIVGAPRKSRFFAIADEGDFPQSRGTMESHGKVYIFERNRGGANNYGEVSVQQPRLLAEAQLGSTVAIRGAQAMAGAPGAEFDVDISSSVMLITTGFVCSFKLGTSGNEWFPFDLTGTGVSDVSGLQGQNGNLWQGPLKTQNPGSNLPRIPLGHFGVDVDFLPDFTVATGLGLFDGSKQILNNFSSVSLADISQMTEVSLNPLLGQSDEAVMVGVSRGTGQGIVVRRQNTATASEVFTRHTLLQVRGARDVVIEGSLVLIGSSSAAGTVQLLKLGSMGAQPSEELVIRLDGATAGEGFGEALALSGHFFAVGSPFRNSNEGAVTLYELVGPDDQWRETYFGSADVNNAAKEANLWGDAADPDGDSLSNVVERFFGFHPRVRESLPLPQISINGSVVRAFFPAPDGTDSFVGTLIAETSENGQSWTKRVAQKVVGGWQVAFTSLSGLPPVLLFRFYVEPEVEP